MRRLRHAGYHWPENAGGEHPDIPTILAVPGTRGAGFICSPSARWHYDTIRKYAPSAPLVWRAIPRPGKLPADLGWNPARVADECLNLWMPRPGAEAPGAIHYGEEYFCPLNELQFEKESGEAFRGYGYVAAQLGRLRVELQDRFLALGQTVRLVWPAWVPSDDGTFLADWQEEAARWDVIGLHCYGDAETMAARYASYRAAFPGKPIFVGEWNGNHAETDEAASLRMWGDIAARDPLLLGVTFYIWETQNPGEEDLSIWGNEERLALFRDPPLPAEAEVPEPVPEPEPSPEPAPLPPPADPWRWFSAEAISAATNAPLINVQVVWPHVVAQLDLAGINTRYNQRAIIPTIAIETGGPDPAQRFTPVREAYWLTEAQRAADPTIARYYPYYGRGLIQRTWRAGYAAAGLAIAGLWQTDPSQPDFDFVSNPDGLLDLDMAAADLAVFWRDTRALPTVSYPEGYSLQDAAREGDTEWLRRLVQGGTAGLTSFRAMYALLGDDGTVPPVVIPPAPVHYDRAYPVLLQNDDWSCWPTSARWALGAIGADADGDGRPPTEAYVESQAVRDGIVSTDLGLLVASGGPAAKWLNEQWLSGMGLTAVAHPTLSYNEAVALAAEGVLLIGGRAWNHWSAVRGVTPEGVLALANPSPDWQGVGQDMDRAEWSRLGPFSAISVSIDGQEDPAMIAELQAQLAIVTAERDAAQKQRDDLIVGLSVAADDHAASIITTAEAIQKIRADLVGPPPAS